ncbi:hypothetical protein ACT3UQ_17365 [Glutamicibacter sp. AOP12-B1-11]
MQLSQLRNRSLQTFSQSSRMPIGSGYEMTEGFKRIALWQEIGTGQYELYQLNYQARF